MGELMLTLVGLAGILVGAAWLLEQLHKKDQHKCCGHCQCDDCHCHDTDGDQCCGCGCCNHEDEEE